MRTTAPLATGVRRQTPLGTRRRSGSGDFSLQLPVTSKRRSFSSSNKAAALRLLAVSRGHKMATARLLQQRAGYETVTRSTLLRWQKAAANVQRRRTGRTRNAQ
jgi:hypothetical protein